MIKILFFIPCLSGGGAEKVLCNLVNNMNQKKFDITVQTMEYEDPEKYLVPGIHYKTVNRYKSKYAKKIFFIFFRICAELKLAYRFFVRGDYDIEVAYLETISTKIIAQSTNKKAVKLAWIHCDLSKKEGIKDMSSKIYRQYKVYDKIVCVSKDVQRGFESLYGSNFKTTVLYNIIDEEEILKKAQEYLPHEEWGKYLLAVGRLTQQKNFAHLIDTCGKLRDDGYKFHVDILGEGPEQSNLEKQIKKLHLEKIVELKGFVKNPYSYMKNADYVVCSSRYEGISSVVVEALILGKPVITTPCTGMKELLGESEFGLIAENTENGLYNSIRKMMDSVKLEEHYIYMSWKRGKYFYKQNMIGETEKFFEMNYECK